MTHSNKKKPEKKWKDESGLSRNHSHTVKYRKRILEEQEAEQEIKEFIPDNIPEDNANPKI